MRTATELIQELHSEAAKFAVAMLVVGFADRGSLSIVGDDADALGKLEQAMRDGGKAIGFIEVSDEWTDDNHGRLSFSTRLLPEWQGNGKAVSFLRRVMEAKAKRFLDSAPALSEEFREMFSDVSEVRLRREWSN